MFSHLKRRIGVFTAVAVLAALVPALATSTASAAPLTTAAAGSDPAVYVACPTGSAAAAGFTDTTSTDVDCIAHFGITTGVTATTYEPNSSIPRWQMALYLTRMLNKASFTLGSGADQGFTDISGESAAIQTAINQLKQAGVTTGTTATTYSPDDNVTREQMAMFLNRALNLITAGVGGQSDGTGVTTVNGAGTGYNYTDIDSGSVTFEGHNSIVEMYSLQVPGHAKTITTFGPSVDISRDEMATWITNALAHTNARPEGLWVQTADASSTPGFGDMNNDLHITHRDASHAPIVGTLVDVFADKTAASSDPFTAAGACVKAYTVELGNTGTECAVDLGDTSTNAIGNLAVTVNGTGAEATNGTTWTYWAHTGAVGTAYDNDSPSNSASLSSSTSATATVCTDNTSVYAAIDSDMGGDLVPYGTTVTITCQLKTALLAAVAMPLSPITITDTMAQNTDDGAGIDGDGGGANATASIVTTVLYTDATGAATYSYTAADPGTTAATVTNRTEHTVVATPTIGSATTFNTQFDDNPAVATSTTMTEGSTYGLGVAVTGVDRVHTVTVRDQYANGVASQTVTFTSDSTSGTTAVTEAFTQSVTRVTDSSGVATFGYTDVQTATAKVVTTASAAGTGTSTFYRIDALTPDFAENENSTTDGTVIATNFNIAAGSTGLVTFNSTHSLAAGDEIIVDLGLVSGEVGTQITLAAHADETFQTSTVHGLEVGDVVVQTTAIGGVNGAGWNTNAFACVRTVPSTQSFTLTASLGTPQTPCTASSTVINITANSTDTAGRIKQVVVPLGTYFVATAPSTTTATLSPSRTVSAAGAHVYTTWVADIVGAASTGTAKRTSASEFDTSDLYMELIILDAANDKMVVENQLLVGDYNYSLYTWDSGDQFNIGGDLGAGNHTAASQATFELVLGATQTALSVPNGADGDIKSVVYNNDELLGGVSVWYLGS